MLMDGIFFFCGYYSKLQTFFWERGKAASTLDRLEGSFYYLE